MSKKTAPEAFAELLDIVKTLRSENGCPWDRAQTPETILPYLVEETFEAVEAIEKGDSALLCEELGDVMLEVALLSQMASEKGDFEIADSLDHICKKLVRRHPHVFGEAKIEGEKELQRAWSEIKASEKPKRGHLEGVPRSLPALSRAKRVSEKAASVGFDWEGARSVLEKINEECAELMEAIERKNAVNAEEELGDILFGVVNLGRHLGVDAERALHRTTEKFSERFAHIEERLGAEGVKLSEAGIQRLEELWLEAKAAQKRG